LRFLNRRSPGSNNPCPYDGGLPYAPTDVQGIGSGVYLHIRQQLLSPTAASLIVGIFPTVLSEDIFLSVTAFSGE
jgi:hypothetical protein